MFFQVTNLDENTIQTNTIKIRANLRNGVTEFLEGHTDMLGRIDNDIILTESIVEGRTIKKEFIIQSGVLIVSNGGLNSEAPKGTYVLVHSKEIVELSGVIDEKKTSDLVKKLEKKTGELEKELVKINMSLIDLKDAEARNSIFRNQSAAKVRTSFEDVEFFTKALELIKTKRTS